MKKILIAVSTLLISAPVTISAAQADNSYVSVLGGWSSHPDLAVGAARVPTNDEYNVGARIGTWLPMVPGFTADLDVFHNRADYAGTGAHLNSTSVMGDLIYHLPTGLPLDLYGGAGVGMVNDNLGGSLHGGSIVMGWQALGGAEWALNSQTSLFAEYRYQNAHNANIGAVRNVGNTSNNVSLGLKFNM